MATASCEGLGRPLVLVLATTQLSVVGGGKGGISFLLFLQCVHDTQTV